MSRLSAAKKVIGSTSSRAYVYSTSTTDTRYVRYIRGGNDSPVPVQYVLIKGGANITNINLLTPRGAVTEVSQEELDFLKQDTSFIRHMKAGFVSYDSQKVDVEVAASNMQSRDESAPLTDNDFIAEGEKPPTA